MYYVYGLINPKTNLPFYIGKGKNNRAKTHLKLSSNDTHNPAKRNMIESLISEGYDIEILYYHSNLSEEKAYILEKQLIKKFGRETHDKNGILTNILEGGQIYYTEDNPNAKKVKINGKVFNTINEAAEYNGVKAGTITKWIKNGKGTVLSDKPQHQRKNNHIYDSGGNSSNAKQIKIDGIEYETIKEASESLNVHRNTILNWIKKGKVEVLSTKRQHINGGFNKKQSDNIKKRLLKKENHPMYGRTHTDETKRKMSESKRKRIQIDGIIYDSCKEGAEANNISRSTINHWIKKGKAHYVD